MCDAHGLLQKPQWRGWISAPSDEPLPPAIGPWVDLTWPFSTDTPRLPHFEAPRVKRVRSIRDGAHANQSSLETLLHIGTHVDAPIHFVDDAPAFQDVPARRLTGPGLVWRIEVGEYEIIEPAHLERARPTLRPAISS